MSYIAKYQIIQMNELYNSENPNYIMQMNGITVYIKLLLLLLLFYYYQLQDIFPSENHFKFTLLCEGRVVHTEKRMLCYSIQQH